MFSLETLEKCAVIKIHDLLPRKIKTSEANSILKDGFLFLGQEGSKLIVHENLGLELTEIEVEHLKKFVSTWGGGDRVDVINGVLEMELPTFLNPFVEKINAIPGCRISPNLLRIGGDVYFYIEFHNSSNSSVSNEIMAFMSKEHLFEKELVYAGNQDNGIPYILKMYRDFGNSLNDLFMITTVWEFTNGQEEYQNQGVFQNQGNYVPKAFVDGFSDKLIFKMKKREILGNSEHRLVDESDNLVEFSVTSRFFSDFYSEIIKNYSGPIFCHMEVAEKKHISHYLIERKRQVPFIKGLLNNWKRDARADHTNYIYSAESLESVIK